VPALAGLDGYDLRALSASSTESATGLDPIANSGCRTMATQSDPGVASWTFTPPAAGTVAGSPVVHVTATLDGSNAELAARLFDVNPANGTQTLVVVISTRKRYLVCAEMAPARSFLAGFSRLSRRR
jgi:hypothetical protein